MIRYSRILISPRLIICYKVLSRRFISNNAKSQNNHSKSIVDNEAKLSKIYSKLEQQKYDEKYAAQISYSKIPSYADRTTKEIALTQPWTGGKSAQDVVTRSANDSTTSQKKAKKFENPFKKKFSPTERLLNAKEKSLDYTLLKHSTDDDPKFREMMREKLLGVEQVTRVSFSDAFFLADTKIAEARERGDFKNIPRGQKLQTGYNQNAFLDQTDYHLNNILKRQEVKLPWIEKQGSVSSEISNFRKELKKEWLTRAVHLIDEKFSNISVDEKIQKAEIFAKNLETLKDPDWEARKKKSLKVSLRHLNNSIRGYNLQAPMTSHKFYLLEDKELEKCYIDAASSLVEETKRYFKGDVNSPKTFHSRTYSPPGNGQASIGSLFWKLFK